jgi:hypothetical protein
MSDNTYTSPLAWSEEPDHQNERNPAICMWITHGGFGF